MNKSLLINIGVCISVCVLIVICELFFNTDIVNTILVVVYFSIPLGMIVLTIVELSVYKKNPSYTHIVNIVKFDIFFILAILSLLVEGAKSLDITLKIGLNEIVAGLATLVALDRVLIYVKIAFDDKSSKISSQNKID